MRQINQRFCQALIFVYLVTQFAITLPTSAADEWERAPGSMTVLYASDEEVQTYVAPPQPTRLRAQAATITVEYQGFPPAAQASFQYAVQIWEALLVAPIPIRVRAIWKPLPEGALGRAFSNDHYINTTTNTAYTVALAKQFIGDDPTPTQPDIIAEFNNTGVNWYFGTGATPVGQFNLATAALHELGHGLGCSDSFGVVSGVGGWGSQEIPLVFDRFVVDGSGVNLLNTTRYPLSSVALAAALQSDLLFFNGPQSRAANNGNPVRLYAPNPYDSGSSIAHLDEESYRPGDPNSLMTPFGARGETNYNPGPLALGMLRDLGWITTEAPPPAPPPATPPSASPTSGAPVCFNQTGKCVPPLFLAQWEARGGLAINGLPLTDARIERLENGKEYFVQWFERVRMEHHPENSPPNDVQLGQFGRLIHPADPPMPQAIGQSYFPQTGHNVPPDFFAFWEANGGVSQFGFPLSEVLTETLEDGKRYQVQYFERARFERHPENAPPNHIQLGQFGRRILDGKASPSPTPSPAANVIFQDNFSNPNSGWPTYKDPQGRYDAGYLPDEYRIALAAANFYAVIVNRNIAPQTNVRMEADMKRFGPVQEPLFGFACRAANPDNYYGAVLDTLGNALIFKIKGGQFTPLASVENHPAIKRGNETNRVRLDCIGTQLTLYANGTPVVSGQDGDFGSGDIGFLVYAFDKGGLDLHIKNFIATRP